MTIGSKRPIEVLQATPAKRKRLFEHIRTEVIGRTAGAMDSEIAPDWDKLATVGAPNTPTLMLRKRRCRSRSVAVTAASALCASMMGKADADTAWLRFRRPAEPASSIAAN